MWNISFPSKGNSVRTSSHSLPSLSPPQPLICFLSLCICLFWMFHINGVLHDGAFCIWLLSLTPVFSRSTHGQACVSQGFVPFLRLSNIPLSQPHLIHPLVLQQAFCFRLLALSMGSFIVCQPGLCWVTRTRVTHAGLGRLVPSVWRWVLLPLHTP